MERQFWSVFLMSDYGVKYNKLVSTGMCYMPFPALWYYAVYNIIESCKADAQVTGIKDV